MSGRAASGPAAMVWGVAALLALLHWDFWFWDDRTLLFGFLPVGLAYQAAYSLAAVALWIVAVRWAWPSQLEAWASAEVPPDAMPAPLPGTKARLPESSH